ncbi:hypothetical protein MTP03_20270 [Tsukamurella sp. PLM1]|nr:hypothetical protein MTP03_20270 [Tsukamurella sp. PLM1]
MTGERAADLSDDDVALLGGALLDLQVRDAAMALGVTVVADEARVLFAELARRLRGTPRPPPPRWWPRPGTSGETAR